MDARIRFDSVHFRYGRRRPVLEDFSWTLPGARTVLLGPNGAGKTTLLMLAAGVFRPSRGSCGYAGLDSRRDVRRYRAGVSIMPQRSSATKGLTVQEHVAYGGWLKGLNRSTAWAEAGRSLEQVGLAALAGRDSVALSGGEARRMALAAALVTSPRAILLDEPTAGLDPAERMRFRGLVSSLPEGIDVLVSTHQVDDLGELYGTVVVLYAGRVKFQGTVGEFSDLAHPATPASGSVMESAYAACVGGVR